MHTHDFNEIAPAFLERAHRMVWCNVATVDSKGRPRSRILHPIWEGQTGWITTNPRSLKSRDLAENPYVSLAYVSEVATPAYADCRAEWVDDPAMLEHVWNLLRSTPEPLGFDPGTMYSPIGAEVEGLLPFGVLKLTPYRIVLTQWPKPLTMWTAE